ncbi:MAG: YARHG domain-containing protein [bacterium]|nr:YARHG domain-containing protein [bacterium]
MRKAVLGLVLAICLLSAGCQDKKETAAGGNVMEKEPQSTFIIEENSNSTIEESSNNTNDSNTTENTEEKGETEVESENQTEKITAETGKEDIKADTSTGTETDAGDFLLPNSEKELLPVRDIQFFSKEELRLAKNEIYARHGRLFLDQELQAYFNQYSWYQGRVQPEAFDDNILNETELKNIELLEIAQATKEAEGRKGTELTVKELEYYTAFVNDVSNNGFLGSKYDRPQDVDVNEVFYNGCGFSDTLTEEERKLLPEIWTDYTKITTAQVNEILNTRLGLQMEDMTHPLNYLYVEEGDFYFFQHGDTNYMPYTCTEGKWIEDSVLELKCKAEYNEEYYNCTVQLKRVGDELHFVSNRAWASTP